MSDSVVLHRRDFLKLVGIGVAGAAAGCAKPPAENLIPFLVAPEELLPGVPYFYASTCRECPVGCGLIVRTREGRAIKLEGNAAHPLNHGGLCARGQAGLQGLYDPDRIKTPLVKDGATWKAATWDEALALVTSKLAAAKNRTVLLTGHETGTMRGLAGEFARATGGKHVMWEPFGYENVRAANRATFGVDAVPHYDLAAARCVLAFGADFLETFGSPVAQARGFADMRTKRDDGAGHFVTIEPRLSATGANADEWIAPKPGTEFAVALGIAHAIVAENLGSGDRGAIGGALAAWTPEAVAQQTEVPAETITRLARLFTAHGPSLALAGGISTQGTQGMALVAAVNLLNHVAGNVGQTVDFGRALDLSGLATFAEFASELAALAGGSADVLVVHGANPLYATPGWAAANAAFAKVPFKVALATTKDETAEACDVILPVSHALESFGDAFSARGVFSLQQPAMKRLPMFDSRPTGDVLIALTKAAGGGASLPDAYHDHLREQWKGMHARHGNGRDFDTFWNQTLAAGGVFEDAPASPTGARWVATPAFAPSARTGDGEYALLLTPSNNFYDGRGANKPWLQELPDMTSKTVWGSWAEIHPETAAKLGVKSGDPVKVQTAAGAVEVPAYVYGGIRKDVVAVALGQGHTSYGRYAMNRGVNAVSLVPQATDPASGALAYQSANATLARGSAAAMPLFLQQAEKNQHDRGIAQVIPIAALLGGAAVGHGGPAHGAPAGGHAAGGHEGGPSVGHYPAGEGVAEAHESMTRPGKFTEPKARPEGWKPPAHAITAFESHVKGRSAKTDPVDVGSYKNAKHRWAMSVDLNRCTGCAACVVACNAENNIPVVGPDLIKKGREMQWIRIDRFEEKVAPGATDVRFVPMMCQHCGSAPCEMVCPVYATYHSPEGLNAQVYNRCVGTRYCSNNCPYKVRSFNWFDYSAPEKTTFAFPEPMNWQLNPDVTVRSKGVMEKCTMCIQRILEGKGNAKDENRAVRDGEIQTACAQSCPAQAITFGDLADPESAVHEKSFGERKYWVFQELNTKPGVTYLQKVTRDTAAGGHA